MRYLWSTVPLVLFSELYATWIRKNYFRIRDAESAKARTCGKVLLPLGIESNVRACSPDYYSNVDGETD